MGYDPGKQHMGKQHMGNNAPTRRHCQFPHSSSFIYQCFLLMCKHSFNRFPHCWPMTSSQQQLKECLVVKNYPQPIQSHPKPPPLTLHSTPYLQHVTQVGNVCPQLLHILVAGPCFFQLRMQRAKRLGTAGSSLCGLEALPLCGGVSSLCSVGGVCTMSKSTLVDGWTRHLPSCNIRECSIQTSSV